MCQPDAVVARLRGAGVRRGDPVGLAIGDEAAGLALGDGTSITIDADVAGVVAAVEDELRPRWVTWSPVTGRRLVGLGVRVATCWDVVTVHRLVSGRWRVDEAHAWSAAHDLAPDTVPTEEPFDLFHQGDAGDPDEPIRADGHLRPDWVGGRWRAAPARWAELALDVADRQRRRLGDDARALATARSESTAELLCAELEVDGLPLDRAEAERLIGELAGPRPRTEQAAAAQRAERDAAVLAHAPPGSRFDLRSPNDVRSLLRRIGVEVPDTRAWRLEALQDSHPLVPALLSWRKAERIATAFGYGWLDAHVGADGRLRGDWTGSDGAAGRMTASAGLHNLPAELRPAVRAEPGHVFVRADLGQIEPRVLAAVSGDRALAAATADADMYAPVARQLGVERPVAKVAVLGAMYGQTTGRGAEVLHRLERAYPVAMAYLADAAQAAVAGNDVRTFGGRRVRMGSDAGLELAERELRSRAAARGRYGRNAVVQGAAAELFKMWALLVRATGAGIVLCLHDELLVHAPADEAATTARLLDDALQQAAARWAPGTDVRFVADVSTVQRWSDAK
ncbi:MAG: DNA polymerase [Ilumatobacteraceae bacterium]